MVPAGTSWQAQLPAAGLGLPREGKLQPKAQPVKPSALSMPHRIAPVRRPEDRALGGSGRAVLSPSSGGNSRSAQHPSCRGV